MNVPDIPLLGRHNVENVMGAILVALAAGLPVEAIREGVRNFRPLAHRLEPVVVIAGGKSKGTDFAELGKVLSSRAKAVVLIGEAAEEIASVVKRAKVEHAISMDDAVHRARDLAEEGDVVLLSPGCASFDMFRSAEHRGEEFA